MVISKSHGKGLNQKLLKPSFTVIEILKDGNKNIQGANILLENTTIRPKKNVILQIIDNDLSNDKVHQSEILDNL